MKRYRGIESDNLNQTRNDGTNHDDQSDLHHRSSPHFSLLTDGVIAMMAVGSFLLFIFGVYFIKRIRKSWRRRNLEKMVANNYKCMQQQEEKSPEKRYQSPESPLSRLYHYQKE